MLEYHGTHKKIVPSSNTKTPWTLMRIPIIDFHTMDTGEQKNAHLYVNKTIPFVMHVKIIYLVLTKQRKENRDICADQPM